MLNLITLNCAQGKRSEGEHQPDVSEFISAVAAGNNSQLMVMACSSGPTTSAALALVAAAHQTGGRVVCILPETLKQEEAIFDESYNKQVECVIGEAQTLIVNEYSQADFVLVDCNLESYEMILKAVQRVALAGGRKKEGVIVLGYNAFSAGSWRSGWGGVEMKAATQLLPIGGGLLITRVAGKARGGCGFGRKGSWVVKVDEVTGEEHVFRVRPTYGKVLHA